MNQWAELAELPDSPPCVCVCVSMELPVKRCVISRARTAGLLSALGKHRLLQGMLGENTVKLNNYTHYSMIELRVLL